MQKVLALLLIKFCLHLFGDVIFDLHHLLLIHQILEDKAGSLTNVIRVDDRLLCLNAQVHVAGDEVNQEGVRFNVFNRHLCLSRDIG